ncbi:unnamed protein product, partial [Iphiclides podalirius]
MNTVKQFLADHLNRNMSPRTTVAIISVISLAASLADFFTDCEDDDPDERCVCRSPRKLCLVQDNVKCMRALLLKLFQVANLVLLLGCLFENANMMQLYIWYTLSFVVFGFVVTIVEFLCHIRREQMWTFMTFAADVMYLFGYPGTKRSHDQVI